VLQLLLLLLLLLLHAPPRAGLPPRLRIKGPY
jgi:hypothetical protein